MNICKTRNRKRTKPGKLPAIQNVLYKFFCQSPG
jgi:hypothetical protein